MTLVQDIISEVEKHHKMKMSPVCVEKLLEILKKHCPHLNKKSCPSTCKCDPCKCDPCKC